MDWRDPDYAEIIAARTERLKRLRADPVLLEANKIYYRDHPADFIDQWGWTMNPKNSAKRLPVRLPFILFPKQRELIDWIMERWRAGEPGIITKSREIGASWIIMALQCTLCVFHKNMMFGVGSYIEDKIDRGGDPDTLFAKARQFIELLPREFRGGWANDRHCSAHMRIIFPETGSSITGQAGDDIGRGGRKAMYAIDESAHLEHPQLVDMALASNTDCRIDISTPFGMANSFAQKAHSGKIKRFDFGWRDDPRKDNAWYEKQKEELDPVSLAQEIDCSFTASVEGIVIPFDWVQSAVDAHKHLGVEPTGIYRGALDVADEGADKNAFAARRGNMLTHCTQWSGKGSDIYATTERAFLLCDQLKLDGFIYDADGFGADVRGAAKRINELRHKGKMRVIPYRGSAGVADPDGTAAGTERTNKDLYENFKAQSWMGLRSRFMATHRARQGEPYKADDIISLDSSIPLLTSLCIQLSQPTYGMSKSGKLLIEKNPDGIASPDMADAVCMLFAKVAAPIAINPAFLEPQYGNRQG